jgi:antitoxin component YwqK of YwqJK toxin-antitoxin module
MFVLFLCHSLSTFIPETNSCCTDIYDSNKNLVRKQTYFINTNSLESESFFRPNGYLSLMVFYRKDSTRFKQLFFTEKNMPLRLCEYLCDGLTLKEQFFFKQNGTLDYALTYYSIEQTIQMYHFYDADGVLIRTTFYTKDGLTKDYEKSFRRDGSTKSITFYNPDGSIQQTEYYNPTGQRLCT